MSIEDLTFKIIEAANAGLSDFFTFIKIGNDWEARSSTGETATGDTEESALANLIKKLRGEL